MCIILLKKGITFFGCSLITINDFILPLTQFYMSVFMNSEISIKISQNVYNKVKYLMISSQQIK